MHYFDSPNFPCFPIATITVGPPSESSELCVSLCSSGCRIISMVSTFLRYPFRIMVPSLALYIPLPSSLSLTPLNNPTFLNDEPPEHLWAQDDVARLVAFFLPFSAVFCTSVSVSAPRAAGAGPFSFLLPPLAHEPTCRIVCSTPVRAALGTFLVAHAGVGLT